MFKKVVSQVTFSPATVQQLAQYATDTRKRQRLHGWAIVALALLIVTCGIVALLPQHHTTTPTANDLVTGGVSSPEAFVSAFDADPGHMQSALDVLDIDRQNLLSATRPCDTNSQPLTYTTGNMPYQTQGQVAYERTGAAPLYIRPVDTTTQLSGWCGLSGTGSPFMISAVDGNILTAVMPAQPQSQNDLVRSQTVSTASLTTGQPVSWTLTVSNPTDQPVTKDIWFATGDIAEYAHITSISERGIMPGDANHALWPALTVESDETRTLTVTAQLNQPVDETARQAFNTHAYDCTVTTVFGNTTNTPVTCPLTKQVESLLHHLPPVSVTAGIILFAGLFIANLCIYLSLRLQSKELRIIRKQLNAGGF